MLWMVITKRLNQSAVAFTAKAYWVTLRRLNPIYTDSPVDDAVSRLVFAGFANLQPAKPAGCDLADSWSVDSTGKVYTVHLKPHLTLARRPTANGCRRGIYLPNHPKPRTPSRRLMPAGRM